MLKKDVEKIELEERFTYKKKNVFYANEIGVPGTRFQIVYFDPSTSIKPHYHKLTTEIFFVLEGEGKILVDGKPILSKKGTVIVIHPHDTHEIRVGKKGLTIAIFKVDEAIEDILWGKSKKVKKRT